MTKSERTFATFRVAGDNLVPDEVTRLLGIEPTLAYKKGEHYKRGPRSPDLKGRTGIWFLTTEYFVESNDLNKHLNWLLDIIANKDLAEFVRKNSLHAVLTCFWHGPLGASAPRIPKTVSDPLRNMHFELETDFDTDGPRDFHKIIPLI
jgi:hypothetical protein